MARSTPSLEGSPRVEDFRRDPPRTDRKSVAIGRGTELYPRLWGWDIKMFTNCRFGMMYWAVGAVCYAAAQGEREGHISNSMMVSHSFVGGAGVHSPGTNSAFVLLRFSAQSGRLDRAVGGL